MKTEKPDLRFDSKSEMKKSRFNSFATVPSGKNERVYETIGKGNLVTPVVF